MAESQTEELVFTRAKQRAVRARFDGGEISTDGGLLLLREVDRRLGLSRKVASVLCDRREAGRVDHSALSMLRQRLFGLIAGWEDLNDADELRHDQLYQLLAGSDNALASAATLCRFENAQDRSVAWAVNRILVEQFIGSFEKPPATLVLDFDATDIPVHGEQEKRFFHGYYNAHCFLPLYVFCGEQLLVGYLRPSNQDVAKHAGAILRLLVRRFREVWPRVKIVFRADSGFCRDLILAYCDRNDIKYIVGISRNERLLARAAALMQQARERYEQTGQKQRLFAGFDYAALTWQRLRWVIAKAEHGAKGENPRFVITNIVGEAHKLYDQRYCSRGEMENRVKEQFMLFADRTSAHRWWANQWRMLLSSLAYTLLEAYRRLGLQGSAMARAQCETIRTKLVKVGAVIVRRASVIRLHFSASHPMRDTLIASLRALSP